MATQWNEPNTSTIRLADGREVQAEVNGKSLDGKSGYVFDEGRHIKVVPLTGQPGVWREEEEEYTPTPADQALYGGLLTVQVVGAIQQAYANGEMSLETYNRLFDIARKADAQMQSLFATLEQGEGKP